MEDATADIPVTPAQDTRNHRRQGDPAPAPAAAPTVASALPADIPSAVPAADLNDAAPGPIPTPVRNEAANPFLTAGPQPDIPVENPGSPASTERRFHMATPSTAARTPHRPQAGRHSTLRARPRAPLDGPAGHKHRHTASDVWTFFEETAGKNGCVFCKYVRLYCICGYPADALKFRQQHAMGTRKKATTFSVKTGTGVLRRHLYEHHANSWIEGCDKLHIPITAKEAQQVVSDYRHQNGQASTNNTEDSETRRPFSNEAFVDAIVEFIVADDQVCRICVRNS